MGLTPLNRMSYRSTIGESVSDPKALMRISGLMLLILVEVRGSIRITNFVTHDANQLQFHLNMLPYASTLSNLSEDSLVCLDSQELPRVVYPEWAINTLRTFGFRYSVTSTPRSPRRSLNL